MSKSEIMIDIETLSTRSHACVIAIACIRFDRNEKDQDLKEIPDKDQFFRRVTVSSCVNLGLHIDENTVKWWEGQDKEVYSAMFDNPEEKEDIKTVMLALTKFIEESGSIYSRCIWSHGASFDIPILSEIYTRLGLAIPWKYINIRDTRTLYELGGIDLRTSAGVPRCNYHHPLHDCRTQIWGVKKAVEALKN